jgi:hypothetical protein
MCSDPTYYNQFVEPPPMSNKETFTHEDPEGYRQRRPIPPDGSGRVRRTRTVSYALHRS